mmetsp:Transcript_17358/g.35793  ORF Transcript_17358/g.35793 Transcript_17358/m.35793 type:complete len:237 (-) Transcript_17358:113-823(-)
MGLPLNGILTVGKNCRVLAGDGGSCHGALLDVFLFEGCPHGFLPLFEIRFQIVRIVSQSHLHDAISTQFFDRGIKEFTHGIENLVFRVSQSKDGILQSQQGLGIGLCLFLAIVGIALDNGLHNTNQRRRIVRRFSLSVGRRQNQGPRLFVELCVGSKGRSCVGIDHRSGRRVQILHVLDLDQKSVVFALSLQFFGKGFGSSGLCCVIDSQLAAGVFGTIDDGIPGCFEGSLLRGNH